MPAELRRLLAIGNDALQRFIDDRAPRMGAALAYYTLFSLAPLLLIVITVAGVWLGPEAASGELLEQLRNVIGLEGAAAIQGIVKSAAWPAGGSLLQTGLGLLLMVIGATTVLAELQDALDTLWRVPLRPLQGWWAWLRARLLSFGLILALAFLLLVSLLAGSLLTALQTWWTPRFGDWLQLAAAFNTVLSQALVPAVFALIYKLMPRAPVPWLHALAGALLAALLFHAGRWLLGLYLTHSGLSSGFGAAGSVVLLLVWVYWSAQILLLGAAFTRACSAVGAVLPEPGAQAGSHKAANFLE
jgi:membrane protein